MLTRIDRVQMAVPDRAVAAEGWTGLLGAELERDDHVAALAARRSSYRLGDGWVELLEPDGSGPVADAVAERGGHLYAAGCATRELDKFVARLGDHRVAAAVERDQVFLDTVATGGHGLRLVVSHDFPQPQVGAVEHLYEVTNLVGDGSSVAHRYAELFGLDQAAFEPIESTYFGYEGVLTLFSPDRLDRLEVITPTAPTNTMGRFFARFGESLYMAFAEVADPTRIQDRAAERGAGFTSVPPPEKQHDRGPDTVFLHPPSLGGMMLGLSRTQHAWLWSGYPERAGGVT